MGQHGDVGEVRGGTGVARAGEVVGAQQRGLRWREAGLEACTAQWKLRELKAVVEVKEAVAGHLPRRRRLPLQWDVRERDGTSLTQRREGAHRANDRSGGGEGGEGGGGRAPGEGPTFRVRRDGEREDTGEGEGKSEGEGATTTTTTTTIWLQLRTRG